ncbi:MAG: amidase [Acidimicrobiales bacterium]
MTVPDFRTVSVEDLASSILDRDLSAVAVTEAALERIEARDGELNSFVAVAADRARREAAAVEQRLDAGERVGPLAGVPIGVKDLEDVAGMRTTKGAAHRRSLPVAETDSILVARLRAAGCVVVGKTNTPEFGFVSDTYNPLFGITRNPWNLDRSPGGSSGGTAAAIAAGMVPLGTGSDGGGSIRIPSALCGLAGHKPSPGRVPGGPGPIAIPDLSVVGPMARRIRDVAAALDVVVGPHPGDLRSLPASGRSWRRALDDPRPPARALYVPSLDGGPVDSEVASVCASAVERVAGLGVDVVESGPLFDDPVHPFALLFYSGVLPAYEDLMGTPDWEEVTPALREMLEQASRSSTVRSLGEARAASGALSIGFEAAMAGFDVVLGPTVAGQTARCGGQGAIDGEETVSWVRFTYPFNLIRRPAGTVNAGFTVDGMPVGLQVVGGMHDDLTVLETVAVLEDLLGLATPT